MHQLTAHRMSTPLKYLRPFLRPQARPLPQAASSGYLRFYSAAQSQNEPGIRFGSETLERRYVSEPYPRIKPEKAAIECKEFSERYREIRREHTSEEEVVIRGKSSPSNRHCIWLILLRKNMVVPGSWLQTCIRRPIPGQPQTTMHLQLWQTCRHRFQPFKV